MTIMNINSQSIRLILSRLTQIRASPLRQKRLSREEAIASLINSYFKDYQDTISDKYSESFSPEYYQQQHETNRGFSVNNWLVNDIPEILSRSPKIITELACGNGMFSKQIAPYCTKVYAVDWAKSPILEPLPSNVEYRCVNIVEDPLPNSDLCCSSDFLEHLPNSSLENTIKKIVGAAKSGYHKIACYDDGHSHLSILPPWEWLQLFVNYGGYDYRVKKVEFRRGDPTQAVVVISNIF